MSAALSAESPAEIDTVTLPGRHGPETVPARAEVLMRDGVLINWTDWGPGSDVGIHGPLARDIFKDA